MNIFMTYSPPAAFQAASPPKNHQLDPLELMTAGSLLEAVFVFTDRAGDPSNAIICLSSPGRGG